MMEKGNQKPKVLHAITSDLSTQLMKGNCGYLKEAGFDIELVSSPGDLLSRVPEREGVPVIAVPIEREISPWKDLKTLFRLWRLIRQKKPLLTNVGTPKAGLLCGLAAWLARVPCRIYTLRDYDSKRRPGHDDEY